MFKFKLPFLFLCFLLVSCFSVPPPSTDTPQKNPLEGHYLFNPNPQTNIQPAGFQVAAIPEPGLPASTPEHSLVPNGSVERIIPESETPTIKIAPLPLRIPVGERVDLPVSTSESALWEVSNPQIARVENNQLIALQEGYDVEIDTKTGNLYVADGGNSRIRLIRSSGQVATLEGSHELGLPIGIALDKQGVLYVADSHFNRIFTFRL